MQRSECENGLIDARSYQYGGDCVSDEIDVNIIGIMAPSASKKMLIQLSEETTQLSLVKGER